MSHQTPSDIAQDGDVAFALRAISYLEVMGLDHDAVVRCLVDECGLDDETALALTA